MSRSHNSNRYSRILTQDPSQGASQAMLYATGFQDEDMNKPQVGIASIWYEGNPCNMHLADLASYVNQSVNEADLVGMRFNTVGVSDAISMGTSGMCYSLQSRDLIADSIETVVSAHFYDGCITIPGCDKNMPGCIMALARFNRPGLMVYGGTIQPGCAMGKPVDIVSAFQSYGAKVSGKIDEQERQAIVKNACPGAGACGGMYTANTMAVAIEALGMSLPYSSSTPAIGDQKANECYRAGYAIQNLLAMDLKPADIMTRKAFDNAMVMVMVMGGSTNAVLHLIAIARALNIPLTLDDFQRISNQVPLLADFKPSGQYVMADLQAWGGTPAVMKRLLNEGYLYGECMSVTGYTIAENLANVTPIFSSNPIVKPFTQPFKTQGHIQILKGNLAEEGAVAKITGKEGERFTGPAKCFDSEEAMVEAVTQNKIESGDVIVIRYEGPKGGPGMPEMLKPTSLIMGAGLGKDVALITDGRFSGGSHGFIVGHIAPEAQSGGNLAIVQDGDQITIDAVYNTIDLHLDLQTIQKRFAKWEAPAYKVRQGTLYKYIKCVASAADGCVTDE
jgi:dihydroxy-acid dehydratase